MSKSNSCLFVVFTVSLVRPSTMIALPNGPLQRVLLFAAISSVALFAFFAVHSAGPSRFLYNEYDDDMNCTRSRLTNTRLSRLRLRVQPLSLTDSIRELYAPLRLPIDATSYTVLDGTEYTLPGEPIWHKPFGKEICIVDVDTRIPTGINQVFNKSRLDWEKLGDEKFMDAGLGRVSAGVLNHYLYGTCSIGSSSCFLPPSKSNHRGCQPIGQKQGQQYRQS
ncbi:hypothetical protein BJ546DRAFT_308158 [Cryomyces antarcticus]